MRQILTVRDEMLLARRFRITEPETYPGLTKNLEKGALPVRILHDYDETPPGGRKAGHKPHVQCCFNHLHWHGYVTEFEDGRIALLGEDCARRDFGNDVIDAIERDYKADRDRQFEIQRLLAIRQVMPAALSELGGLELQGFDTVWQSLMQRYGKASRMLAQGARSSNGRLIAYRKEYDRKATEAAAEKAQPVLFNSPDVAAQKKYLEQHRIYKDVSVDMGPCNGWHLLNASERSTPARLAAEAYDLLSKADDVKPIERWGRTDFARMRRALEDAFAKLDEAAGLVTALLHFASPDNLERIAKWAEKRQLKIEISLPDGYGWPSTPAIGALRAAFNGPS